jgi:predicted ArsR family transcriptional regulator
MGAMEMFRKKFETYRKVLDESGEKKAHDTLFEGYPERQKKAMGPLLENNTLYEAFVKAVEIYKQFGMVMKPVNVSNNNIDAVIEVHYVCPFIEMARDYAFDRPCQITCDLDNEATEAAFNGMTVRVLSRQSDGDCVCIVKYERPRP